METPESILTRRSKEVIKEVVESTLGGNPTDFMNQISEIKARVSKDDGALRENLNKIDNGLLKTQELMSQILDAMKIQDRRIRVLQIMCAVSVAGAIVIPVLIFLLR